MIRSLIRRAIRHQVMIGVKEGTSESQISAVKDALAALSGKCKYLNFAFGYDLKLPSGQNHPAGKNRACTWYADFASVDDYDAYAKHPDHIKVIEDCIKPIMEPGSRAAIQFQC
mmetsp:Transcript_70931/g.125379  ORF Transcript_70931/g.125379 Transcript_70931/m.125379 type:complete len:114 (-) Transcript_70931:491-832(-)